MDLHDADGLTLVFELILPFFSVSPKKEDLELWNTLITKTRHLSDPLPLQDVAFLASLGGLKDNKIKKKPVEETFKYRFNLTFPVDEKHWQPLDPPLPITKNQFWLIPEGKEPSDHEMILIETFPKGSLLADVQIVSGIPKGAKVYENKKTKNFITFAYDNFNQGFQTEGFSVDHFFQSSDGVYYIHYSSHSSAINEESKKKWIANIQSATNKISNDQSAWLQITPKGVFQNGLELTSSDSFKSYKNPQKGFKIDIPHSWAWDDTSHRDAEDLPNMPHTGSYCHFMGTRMDNLGMCLLSISEHHDFPDDWFEQVWPDLLTMIKRDHNRILEEGDIMTTSGLPGKFMIYKTYDGGIFYKAIYLCNGTRFKIDCLALSDEGFVVLRETFHKILTSFSPYPYD